MACLFYVNVLINYVAQRIDSLVSTLAQRSIHAELKNRKLTNPIIKIF